MTDIFDVIDRKLPDVRASVRRNLKRRVREGALVASVRHGKLQFEASDSGNVAVLETEVRTTDIVIKRSPVVSMSEMQSFALTKR